MDQPKITPDAPELRAAEPPAPDPLVAAFLNYLGAERNDSPHTLEGYRMDIEQFSRTVLKTDAAEKAVDWNDVSVHDARMFVVSLQNDKLTRTSISRKMSALRSFYRYLVREGRVEGNPFSGLPRTPVPLS